MKKDYFKKHKDREPYLGPVSQREYDLKRERRQKWLRDNWIGLATLAVAVVTLITSVLFGLLSLLY